MDSPRWEGSQGDRYKPTLVNADESGLENITEKKIKKKSEQQVLFLSFIVFCLLVLAGPHTWSALPLDYTHRPWAVHFEFGYYSGGLWKCIYTDALHMWFRSWHLNESLLHQISVTTQIDLPLTFHLSIGCSLSSSLFFACPPLPLPGTLKQRTTQ